VKHTAFFGDAEYTFMLSPSLIVELQRLTDTAFGALCQRMFAGQAACIDAVETIRLGLVGGGLSPERAKSLVDIYVPMLPLAEVHELAVAILEARWLGTPIQEKQEEINA